MTGGGLERRRPWALRLLPPAVGIAGLAVAVAIVATYGKGNGNYHQGKPDAAAARVAREFVQAVYVTGDCTRAEQFAVAPVIADECRATRRAKLKGAPAASVESVNIARDCGRDLGAAVSNAVTEAISGARLGQDCVRALVRTNECVAPHRKPAGPLAVELFFTHDGGAWRVDGVGPLCRSGTFRTP